MAIAPSTRRSSTGKGLPTISSNALKYRKGESHPIGSRGAHSRCAKSRSKAAKASRAVTEAGDAAAASGAERHGHPAPAQEQHAEIQGQRAGLAHRRPRDMRGSEQQQAGPDASREHQEHQQDREEHQRDGPGDEPMPPQRAGENQVRETGFNFRSGQRRQRNAQSQQSKLDAQIKVRPPKQCR